MRNADWAGAERRLLAVLRGCGRRAPVAAAARALSFGGEHGALWLAAGLTGAAVDRERRTGWLRGTALVAGAHLASMGIKRVVRRPRPGAAEYEPLVRTAGRHSFPSSHAASAAAAAVAFGALRPTARRLAAPAAAAMCVSRLIVGVHYPTDVAAGALLGAATAALGRAWLRTPVTATVPPHARVAALLRTPGLPGSAAPGSALPGPALPWPAATGSAAPGPTTRAAPRARVTRAAPRARGATAVRAALLGGRRG